MRLLWVILIAGILVVSGCIIRTTTADCEKPGLTQDERDTCYHVVAKSRSIANNCANIQSIEIRNNCYYEVAQDTGKLEVCDRITKKQVAGDTVLCSACKKSIDPSLRIVLEDCTTA